MLSTSLRLLIIGLVVTLASPFSMSSMKLRTAKTVLLAQSGQDADKPADASENEPPSPVAIPGEPTMPMAPRQPVNPQKAVAQRRLDPLVASVTRMDSPTSGETLKVPFFGEIPNDGSLLILAPVAAIAVLGFLMSIVVAYNARDTFVDQLSMLSDEIAATALQKTNQVPLDGSCRGLCSTQEQDLNSLRSFMEAVTKGKTDY